MKEKLESTPQKSNPLVSIIIPYYNLQDLIAQTVQSAKRQTYSNVEIIVIDDGSPVPAAQCLEGVSGIRIIRRENHGCAASRNFGFTQSSGEYLIFLDGDDLLLPGAIEAHLQAFNQNPQAGLSFGAVRIIDLQGNEVQPPSVCRPRKDYFPMLLESNPIVCPGSAMIRRDAFVDTGGFDESFRNAEDYHLYLKLARLHPLVRNTFCVAEYRKHGGGKSQNKERMTAAALGALDKLQKEYPLSAAEQRKLQYGRNRWLHTFQPEETLAYRLKGYYYSFRAMLTVPIGSYFGAKR